jgi:NADPH:quinone reductase-like Zn-dependent oxidoreductase
MAPFVSQKLTVVMAKGDKRNLTALGELMETGKLTPVIDRRYSLSEVPEGIRYLERGHAQGRVIIVVA